MKRGGFVFVFLISIFCISFVSASVPQTLSVHGKLTDSSGNALNGNYAMSFSIYNVYSGGTPFYQSNQTVTVNSDGTYDVILNNVNLTFNQSYFLGIKVGSDNEMTPRLNLSSSPYSFYAQNVSVSGIYSDSNLNLGNYNLTASTGFFSYLGSLANQVINFFVNTIYANVINANTIGNSSTIYYGNGSSLTGITASASPSGTDTAVQYNNAGTTGGNASAFWFNNTQDTVGINGSLLINGVNWSQSKGAIIASGNNSNGYWIQYADGTMVEWGRIIITTDPSAYAYPLLPIPAVNNAYIGTASVVNIGSGGVNAQAPQIYFNGQNTTNMALFIENAAGNAGLASTTLNITYTMYGKWTNLNLGSGSGGTGGIVNTITNANGTCTEYANGIAECYNFTASVTTDSASTFYWTYPITFASTPIYASAESDGGPQEMGIYWPSTTNTVARIRTSTPSGTVNNIAIVAIGRWTNSTNINTPDVSTWGLSNDANQDVVLVNSSKNVGINTTTPQNTLNVVGTANVTATLTVNGNNTIGQGIVASGSNANGYYIEFADGTMEEWGTVVITAASGTYYFTFPVALVGYTEGGASAALTVNQIPFHSAQDTINAAWAHNTTTGEYIYTYTAGGSGNNDLAWHLIGKWK